MVQALKIAWSQGPEFNRRATDCETKSCGFFGVLYVILTNSNIIVSLVGELKLAASLFVVLS